ncbi:MAG: DUF4252 domain-containing protein [Pseudohongiellaceae bacterium]
MKIFTRILAPLFCLCLIPVVMAASDEVENHPGFVDFARLTRIAASEPTVEISLKAPLLNMITNLIRSEDQEAADFISKLLRVTVNVFESEDIDVDEVAASMSVMAQDLDATGWERVVRVREDSSHVDIYFRLADNAEVIYGIAIMIAEPGETVLVNIVGDISTDDISALGRRFELDELVDLEVTGQ